MKHLHRSLVTAAWLLSACAAGVAQAAEATVNRQSAPTNSQRRLSTRVSRPVSGIAITSAMR